MKLLTMITVNGMLDSKKDKKRIVSYTFISNDYQIITMSAEEVKEKILRGNEIEFNNLGIENGEIVGTNGSIDKYTFVDVQTGAVKGAKAVILNRVEQGNKLIGYTALTQDGKLAELSVKNAALLANQKLISNGKIRHTSDGDIVSAIGGTYPLKKYSVDKAPDGVITIQLSHFGKITGTGKEYFSGIIKCTSVAQLYKLDNVLNKSNAEVVASAAKVAGQSIRKKLGIFRVGAVDIAGSFETETLEKLLKLKNIKMTTLGDTVSISAYDYRGEETAEHSDFTVDTKWKVVGKESTDSSTARIAEKFAQKIVSQFGKVEFQNTAQ